MLRNSFPFFEVGQAAAKLRATVVPVNFHLKHEGIAYVLNDSDAPLLVFAAEFRSEIAGAAAEVTAPARHHLLMDGAGPLPAGAERLDEGV